MAMAIRLLAAFILATITWWLPNTYEPRVVQAAINQNVIVSAKPNYILVGPTSLILSDRGGIGVGANWSVTENITSVLLLVSRSGFPTTPTLNYEIAYAGNAASANLTGYALENTKYYFGLWGWNESEGKYSDTYVTGEIGTLFEEEELEMEGVVEELTDFNALLVSLYNIVQGILIFLPILMLSAIAIWKENAVLFILVAGLSIMTGLYMPDLMSGVYSTTTLGITLGLCLIGYSLLCCGWAFRLIFWRGS